MSVRVLLIWSALAAVMAVPTALSLTSPLLAWRDPIYIAAGLAGIVSMTLLLVQPLLATRALPGLSPLFARRLHVVTGAVLVLAITVHVGGLWLTSPPDVVDALLFRSPTPFSAWGVVAMWAVFAAALVAFFRRRLRLRPAIWRLWHAGLAMVVVASSAVHALLILGTMEPISKAALCALVVGAALFAVIRLRLWTGLTR